MSWMRKAGSIVTAIVVIVLFGLVVSDYTIREIGSEVPNKITSHINCGSELMCIENITFPAMHINVPESRP